MFADVGFFMDAFCLYVKGLKPTYQHGALMTKIICIFHPLNVDTLNQSAFHYESDTVDDHLF